MQLQPGRVFAIEAIEAIDTIEAIDFKMKSNLISYN